MDSKVIASFAKYKNRNDATSELPLLFMVTKASEPDIHEAPRLVEQMAHRQPEIVQVAETLAADVERVNSRWDVSFGFEVHTIRGMSKMEVRCGLALSVMLAMALGRIKEKQADKMRSLVWSA